MKEFNFAIKQTFPIFFTYLFIGIAFGILMGDAGYPPFLSLVAGFFIYAGSLQIVMVSLLQAHAPLITVAIMSFFINARHIFYGVAFIEKFRKMGWKYPYMVLTLTDETYSILCSVKYEENLDREKVDFYISFVNHMYWIFGCILGSYLGNFIPWDMRGIDFSATAFFLYIVVFSIFKISLVFLERKIILFICFHNITKGQGIISCPYIILGADRFLIPALSLTVVILTILKEKIGVE